VQVLKERVGGINAECRIHVVEEFFTPSNSEKILSTAFACVLDGIDDVGNKALLLAECVRRKIAVVTAGGAGGRRDPTAVRVADLAFATHDRLMQRVRKVLRTQYGFSGDGKTAFGIPCVYSTEAPVFPQSDGTVCKTRGDARELRMNCNSGYGSATFVTGAFGFAACAQVVRLITADAASSRASDNRQ
jgi:tRNA A37 threonylcarbamoyladenosine dehydratase